MKIIWHGYSCFSLKTKHGTAVIDPYSADIGLKLPALKADVVLVSHDHPGHNNTKAVTGAEAGSELKILDWAGEYEIKGMAITAQMVPYSKEGSEKEPGKGLIFTIDIDNLKVCFVGDLGGELDDTLMESIGNVDILILPVGGHHTMDAKQAHLLIEEIEPRAVIPMHYSTPGLKEEVDGIEPFLKQAGASVVAAKNEFEIDSRSELDSEKTAFILLNPQTA